MKRKDWIIKTSILVIGILVIVALWFMFAKIDSYLTKVDKLEKENKEQKELIERLEYARDQEKSESSNNDDESIKDSVELFIQSVFTITQTNYEDRKKDGENILSNEIYSRIFSSDEELEVNFEYHPSNVSIYTNPIDDQQASAFVTFDNQVKDLNTDTSDHEYTVLEVHLNKQGDLWVVDNFEILYEDINEKIN